MRCIDIYIFFKAASQINHHTFVVGYDFYKERNYWITGLSYVLYGISSADLPKMLTVFYRKRDFKSCTGRSRRTEGLTETGLFPDDFPPRRTTKTSEKMKDIVLDNSSSTDISLNLNISRKSIGSIMTDSKFFWETWAQKLDVRTSRRALEQRIKKERKLSKELRKSRLKSQRFSTCIFAV